jgi:hypothetical protein
MQLHIDLVVRFSNSSPDITLDIHDPETTSILSLKQRIRRALQPPASNSRLRLIHAGKVLVDTTAVSKSLHINLPPPRSNDSGSAKGKGKQAIRDAEPPIARIYVHCSVGDVLTPSELASEQQAAHDADLALLHLDPPTFPIQTSDQNVTTTTPAPRGFDRLLSAGFTSSEVAALRAQFLAIQAHSHTPDTMPTGQELLALEERWLDNTSNPAESGGAGDMGGFGSEDVGGLEDMLYGNLMGFFWPIGAMFWLMREEGVWSRRRQIAVLSGFIVNLTFGFLRMIEAQ